MKVKSTDFKSFCDEFLSQVKTNKDVKSNSLCSLACAEFGIGTVAFCKRFKSYYGMTVSEKVNTILQPTRNELVKAIILSECVGDLWETLNLSQSRRVGLFDKHFGVSTFERARAICLMETFEVKYNPTIDENKSLVVSQILGDGHYCSDRQALTISHGIRQSDYVYYKAALFNKAFPHTNPAGSVKTFKHKQGHEYVTWYSRKLPTKITEWVKNATKDELVKALTPFGMCLYFMDDGYLNFDLSGRGNNYVQMYVQDGLVLSSLVEELKTYGISTTVSNNYLKIGTMDSAVMFYKCFIEPFKDNLPDCLRYKTEMKI